MEYIKFRVEKMEYELNILLEGVGCWQKVKNGHIYLLNIGTRELKEVGGTMPCKNVYELELYDCLFYEKPIEVYYHEERLLYLSDIFKITRISLDENLGYMIKNEITRNNTTIASEEASCRTYELAKRYACIKEEK